MGKKKIPEYVRATCPKCAKEHKYIYSGQVLAKLEYIVNNAKLL